MVKRLCSYFFVSAGILSCFLFSACSKENTVPDSVLAGSEVSFVPVIVQPGTKTSYGTASGTTYPLNWENGDQIRIYSPQAGVRNQSSKHWADYVYSNTPSVSGINGENLIWGNVASQTFYGIYPSPEVNGDIRISEVLEKVVVDAVIPKVQKVTQSGTTANWLPDMKYAYMFAGKVVSAAPSSAAVDLQFKPMFTAFQIQVAPQESSVQLTGFRMTASGKCMSGSYTGTITANATTANTTMALSNLPLVNPDDNGIEVNFNPPVTVKKGAYITFIVFAVPHAYTATTSAGFTLEFLTADNGDKPMVLKMTTGTKTFDANKRFNLNSIQMPVVKFGDIQDMTIDDNNLNAFNYPGLNGIETMNVNDSYLNAFNDDVPEGKDITDKVYINDMDVQNESINAFLGRGVFTASNGRKVVFTRGNLYYNGTTGNLHFEQNQWDSPTARYSYHVGLFFNQANVESAFSTGGAVSNPFYSRSTPLTVDGISGLYAPTRDDWKTILNFDNDPGYRKGARFAKAMLKGVHGLLVFPDNYVLPKIYTYADGGEGMSPVNDKTADYPEASVPENTWNAMESDGVVFLPVTGRYPGGGNTNISDRENGFYASSDGSSRCSAAIEFSGSVLQFQSEPASGTYSASAVRLVKTVE